MVSYKISLLSVLPTAIEDFNNNNSGNLANTIKGLNKFDRRKPSQFGDWHKKLAVIQGVTGQTRPTQKPERSGEARAASEKSIAEFDRANKDLYAILYLLTDKPATLLVAKHVDATGTSGNGQQALLDLVNKYKKVMDEVLVLPRTH